MSSSLKSVWNWVGPVRAEVRSEVEGVVFPHYSEPDWTSALWSSKVPVVWATRVG